MKDQTKPFAYPDNFRQRLHNLKLDAQETLAKILEEWKVKHERLNATYIEIPERSRTHIQPIISLGPDSYITIVGVNADGVYDEDENFFGWDDLGHENDIVNVAEYVEGIRTLLLGNNPLIMIENILFHSNNSGESSISLDVQITLAKEILDKLRKESQLNPFGGA